MLRGRRQNRGDCRAWGRLAPFPRPQRGPRRERGWPLLVSCYHARPLAGFWKAFPSTPLPFLGCGSSALSNHTEVVASLNVSLLGSSRCTGLWEALGLAAAVF